MPPDNPECPYCKVFADPRHQQYCLSNPGLLSLMTEAVLQWIAENPGRLYYPVHHGDVVRYCECDECQARPWSAPVNMKLDVLADLEGWIAVHPLGPKGIIAFEYPTAQGLCGLPFPALYAFVENMRHYQELGLRGVHICGISRWSHLAHLYSYIISRILWNPDYDLTKLIEDFSCG